MADRMNREQAAEYLGISRATLDTCAVRGGGPAFYKLGRRVVYDRVDLDAWRASRKVTRTSDAASLPRQIANRTDT